MLEQQKARPPYVTFETKAIKNEANSQKAGHVVYDDVDFAIIMPIGGKDKVEREADSWLAEISRKAEEDLYPAEWVVHFKGIYDLWKQGKDIPANGLSVKMWPVATPAEVKTLIDARVFTVEDLAAANEETLMRLGMNSRVLKQKAEAYLLSSDKGKATEAMAQVKQDLEAALLRIAALEKENVDLVAQLNVKAKAA